MRIGLFGSSISQLEYVGTGTDLCGIKKTHVVLLKNALCSAFYPSSIPRH